MIQLYMYFQKLSRPKLTNFQLFQGLAVILQVTIRLVLVVEYKI